MSRPIFPVVACLAALAISAAPEGRDAPPGASALRVTIVIPRYRMPDGTASLRTLINQQADASFDVVVENVSDRPITVPIETSPLSFEVTEGDGSVIKLTRPEADGSRRGTVCYLDPGEYRVMNVTYATQEQYIRQRHHAPPLGHGWTPEFPFKRGGPGRTITLRAVYEEKAEGRITGNTWVGRAVSAPVDVKLDQG